MKPLHWILLGLLNAGTLVLYFFGPEHPYPHPWDAIPLFYAFFGFTGCILIIVVSKALGKAALQKDEDYYDGHDV
jgi:hypothetical protein